MTTLHARFGKIVAVGTARRFAEAIERFASSRPPGCIEGVSVETRGDAIHGLAISRVARTEVAALEKLLADLAETNGLGAFSVERSDP